MVKKIDFTGLSVHEGPEDSPGYLLWRVSVRWRRAIETVLKPLGLTHPQFVILATIGWLTRAGGMASQAEIGRHAGLDPNTTSQILRGLQTKKLISRSHTVDDRSKHPVLADSGAALLSKALPAVESADAVFFAAIDLKKSGMLAALQSLA